MKELLSRYKGEIRMLKVERSGKGERPRYSSTVDFRLIIFRLSLFPLPRLDDPLYSSPLTPTSFGLLLAHERRSPQIDFSCLLLPLRIHGFIRICFLDSPRLCFALFLLHLFV